MDSNFKRRKPVIPREDFTENAATIEVGRDPKKELPDLS